MLAVPEDIVLCEPGLAPRAAPVVHDLLQHCLVHLHGAARRELGNYAQLNLLSLVMTTEKKCSNYFS